MYTIVETSSGVKFIIDSEDYEKVSKHSWKCDKNGYIRRTVWIDKKAKKSTTLALHRFLLNAPDDICVDHINGDILDNRKTNLRLATKAQNNRNAKPSVLNTSGYKGVSYCKESGKWKAQVTYKGKRVNLGRFSSKEDAARMYNFWAADIYGEFAWLNRIEEGE
ncbi:HNH endonuclease [Niallia sp. FSL M8-0099]|uniref:HNH endonuclease n=1 Tax=Niallia sp. FSL M8-0099 TaxID=2954519 RepID=UPI0030F98BDF